MNQKGSFMKSRKHGCAGNRIKSNNALAKFMMIAMTVRLMRLSLKRSYKNINPESEKLFKRWKDTLMLTKASM
jgi:hypothetical protein